MTALCTTLVVHRVVKSSPEINGEKGSQYGAHHNT